jgi:hypothetical protein
MADNHFIPANSPDRACRVTIPAGTLGGFDTQTLHVHALWPNAQSTHGFAFDPSLHKDSIGLNQEPAEVRRGVLPACMILRIIRIAQMEERRKKEWHLAPTRKSQGANQWE